MRFLFNQKTVFFLSSRRRHTRYWRDWSSGVCSSDRLDDLASRAQGNPEAYTERGIVDPNADIARGFRPGVMPENFDERLDPKRSEERRVGKECRSRW